MTVLRAAVLAVLIVLVAGLAPVAAFAAPLPAGNVEDHLDYQRAQQFLAVPAGETASGQASCPAGYLLVDGSALLQHVDQGEDTRAVHVISAVRAGTGAMTFTVENDTHGQAQLQLMAACLGSTTAAGGTISTVSTATASIALTGAPAVVACPSGSRGVAPAWALPAGSDLSTATPSGDGSIWTFTASGGTGQGLVSVVCLSTSTSATSGLDFTQVSVTATGGDQPGSATAVVPVDYSTISAGWSGTGHALGHELQDRQAVIWADQGAVTSVVLAVRGYTVDPATSGSAASSVTLRGTVASVSRNGRRVVTRVTCTAGCTGQRGVMVLTAPTTPGSHTTVTVSARPKVRLRTGRTATVAFAGARGHAALARRPGTHFTITWQGASTILADVPAWLLGHNKPTITTDPASGTSATVSWPMPDPGAAGGVVDAYRILGGGTSSCDLTRSCLVTGLTPGHHYTFRIRARNAVGWSRPSRGAPLTPDRVPDPITDLRPTAESDGTIAYQWTRPAGSGTEFTAVTSYLVALSDRTGLQTVSSTAAQPTFTATGVANGAPLTITVYAVDALGPDHPSTGVSDDTGMASGAPAAPAITSVTGVDVDGGDDKAVTVSWSAVAPNGRGGTEYELYQDGAPASACGSWTSATTCVVTLPNNGSTHAFQVRATNQAGITPTSLEGAAASHVSPLSVARQVVVAGTPLLSGVVLTATGGTGQLSLFFTAGASRGQSGTVTCVNSTVICSFSVGSGGALVGRLLNGLQDGSTATVTLRYCNEAAADAAMGTTPCVTSAPVTASPYGAITAPTLSPTVSGTTVMLHATVQPHGRAVTMTITRDGTVIRTCSNLSAAGSGTVSCDVNDGGLRYDAQYPYTLTVTDASGSGRAQATASASARTVALSPSLSVSLSGSKVTNGYCTSDYCRAVQVSGSGFPPNTQLTLYYDSDCNTSNSGVCESQTSGSCGAGQNGEYHYACETVTTDGGGGFGVSDRLFGWPGARVWVDVTQMYGSYGGSVTSNSATDPH